MIQNRQFASIDQFGKWLSIAVKFDMTSHLHCYNNMLKMTNCEKQLRIISVITRNLH